jgi:Rrf2 family protein
MFLSAKAEYACLAMLELATQYGRPTPIRLTEIAEKHGIPQRFLVQILLQLKGSGLVSSTRGAAGGYHLARRPDQINLNDIMDAVDPPDVAEDRGIAPSVLASSLQAVWKRLAGAREKILTETTLNDLLPRDHGTDFVI